MPRQIIIGRQGNQPFALNDPKVSSRHAVLVVHENGQLQLMDTNSTNGTFIYNGRDFARIQPQKSYTVTADSMIQLGPETRFHVRKLLGSQIVGGQPGGGVQKDPISVQPPKPPKRRDISHLRKISDRYTEKKMELEAKSANINSMRSLTLVASLVAGGGGGLLAENLGFGADNKAASWILGIVLALVLIVVLMLIISNRSQKLMRQRNENEHDYAVKYCCPECGVSFRGKVYENILSEHRCPKCKTEYYEAPRRP